MLRAAVQYTVKGIVYFRYDVQDRRDAKCQPGRRGGWSTRSTSSTAPTRRWGTEASSSPSQTCPNSGSFRMAISLQAKSALRAWPAARMIPV